jgi:capsular exopolysaccharide synthesis family protein
MELRSYFSIIFRRKWLIVIVAGLLIVLTGLAINLLPNKYSSSTRLRILTPKSGGANYVDYNIYYATRLMNTYAALASSTTMVQDIKDKLKLTIEPNINVSVIADSELIKITSVEDDPTLSAVIANTVAEMLVSQSNAGSENIKSSSENAINDRLDKLNAELAVVRKVYKQLVVPYNQNNNQITALNNQIANDQQLYISLNSVYEQNIQLTHVNDAALTSLKNQLSDLEKQISANKATVEQLSLSTAENSVQIASAQGDITLKEQEYTALITQLDQIQVLEAIQGNNQLIIEEKAVIPKIPSSPNRLLVSIIGYFLSIFVAIIIGFIVDNLDDTFRSIKQLQLPINITDFGEVYLASNPIKNMLKRIRQNEVFESNHTFRNFHRHIQKQKLKTLAFCGTEPGSSISALTTRLSIEYANSGTKVLLMDANIPASDLHRFFPELTEQNGLSEYLNGDLSVEEIISPTNVTNLSIIQPGSSTSSDSLLLGSKKMLVLLRTLKSEYDLVFIEIPPFIAESDIDDLVSHVDGVVVVLHQNRSRMKNAKYISKQILELNAPLVGYIVAHL